MPILSLSMEKNNTKEIHIATKLSKHSPYFPKVGLEIVKILFIIEKYILS